MTKPSIEQLHAIRQRLDAVPKSPWSYSEDNLMPQPGGVRVHRVGSPALNADILPIPVGEGSKALAEFVSHSPEDVAYLLSVIVQAKEWAYNPDNDVEGIENLQAILDGAQ